MRQCSFCNSKDGVIYQENLLGVKVNNQPLCWCGEDIECVLAASRACEKTFYERKFSDANVQNR